MIEEIAEVALEQLRGWGTMMREILAVSIGLSSPTASHDVLRRGMQCWPEIDRQADRQG
jgi:adenylyl- and sulfurtransferase ThiI